MTIPQLKRSFDYWKTIMNENINDPSLKEKLMKKVVSQKDVRLWRKEIKRADKILWIIENEPHRICTKIDGNIVEE